MFNHLCDATTKRPVLKFRIDQHDEDVFFPDVEGVRQQLSQLAVKTLFCSVLLPDLSVI